MINTLNPGGKTATGVFCCLLLGLVHTATGAAFTPLHNQDMNPLVMIHGLPSAGAAIIADKGSLTGSVHLSISNTLNAESPGGDFLLIDGETYKLDIVIDYAWRENWNARFTLPLISHQDGIFDSAIDDFHSLLNFPNGSRPFRPADELLFFYRDANGVRVLLDNPTSGLGDVALDLTMQLPARGKLVSTVSAGLKLPSGSAARLTGSDRAAVRAWYTAAWAANDVIDLYGHAGIQFMNDGGFLAEKQNHHVEFGSVGVRWQAWPWISLLVQADFHTALYENTNLTFLSDSWTMGFGASFELESNTQLDLSFSEDIKVGASPDVVFVSSFRYGF